MGKARIELDHPGIGEMLKSSDVRAELTRRATRMLDAARASAPVDTGAYKAGLHLQQDTTDRAVVRVVADDAKSAIIEARQRILGSAIDAGRS
jgi:hypothetical protein